VNDPVDRVIADRAGMDRGFRRGLLLSGGGHVLLVLTALIASFLAPREPLIKIADGFAAPMPRGGRGIQTAEPPAPAEAPQPAPSAAPAEPPKPQIQKPPKEEPRKGPPELSEKGKKDKKGRKPKETPAPTRQGGVPGGTGRSSELPGLPDAPVGIGVPYGTELTADWYIATVQQRIWALWVQQIKAGMQQPVIVQFTIEADGSVSVAGITIVQSSGAPLLDLAAKRAIATAAPFGPLPKHYGTNRITIQGIFKPTA
jgi:TonB family protein